jgi:hypothetical protein
MLTYPFIKVTLAFDVNDTAIHNGGMTAHVREDDPGIPKMLAEGWTITRRWEVIGPRETRDLPIDS